MENMSRSELIESVLSEMHRVWGPEGFHGEDHAYVWLREQFAILEEDDVQWQDILSYWSGTFDLDTVELAEDERERVKAFLQDESAVKGFLETLLQRYRSSDATYSGLL